MDVIKTAAQAWKKGFYMSIRQDIFLYAKGDNLDWLWKLYEMRLRSSNQKWKDFLTFWISRSARKHGGYIGKETVFEGRPRLPHGLHGIYISRYAHIGKECWIYQNVTIGEVKGKAPTIGSDCLIGAGAVLVGDIHIGNNVKIGAGAVVNQDVPDNATVVCQPCRVLLSQKGQENRSSVSGEFLNI